MYKETLKLINDTYFTIDQVIEDFAAPGTLFNIKSITDKYYEIVFVGHNNSSIVIDRLAEKDILERSPRFYLDDDDVYLTAPEMMMAVLIDRFNYLKSEHKLKHFRFLMSDIRGVTDQIIGTETFTYNAKLKNSSRIRVVKTWSLDKQGNRVYDRAIPLGKALWSEYIPKTPELITEYASKFNDPIAVKSLTDGIYCHVEGSYKAVGFNSNTNSLTSIFPQKSNLPERLRQHYVSEFLQPKYPETDWLTSDDRQKEKINAIAVFLPIDWKDTNNYETDHPLGKWTLACGEIPISAKFASREFYVRRTYRTSSVSGMVCRPGTVVNYGDVLYYNAEGEPDTIYDSHYKNGEVVEVIKLHNQYKIIVKILSELGVGRVMSDYGIKGVTHPRFDLGTVKMPDFEEGSEEFDVDMVVGPISMKGMFNSIRLSWLSYKQAMLGQYLDVDPYKLSASELDELTSDLVKCEWYINDRTYEVWAGMPSVGITDISRDCKTEEIKMMPETLKYMYSIGGEMSKVADKLLEDNIYEQDKWALSETMKLLNKGASNELSYSITDKLLIDYMKTAYFNTNTSFNSQHRTMLLLDPANNGFSINVNGINYRFPSARLLNYYTEIVGINFTYPQFMSSAMALLLSIKQLIAGKATEEQVFKNAEFYYNEIKKVIFQKKGALPTLYSPSVIGGHLKQLVSSYVPRGVTVVVDKKLESIVNKNNLDFIDTYEIGVRNPVLWRFMLSPKKVWTLKMWEGYLKSKRGISCVDEILMKEHIQGSVIRNMIDTLYDKADADGDLYPVCIPEDKEVQILLSSAVSKGVFLTYEHEDKWIWDYITDEMSKNKYVTEVKPFEFHTVSRIWFSETMANAAIAKMNVGKATVDLWKFHSAAESWYADGKLTKKEKEYQQFLFSKVVQSLVVEGIKHNSGGSSGYAIFETSSIKKNYEDVIETLKSLFLVNDDDAITFANISMSISDIDKAGVRLATGGEYGGISKLFSVLPNVAPHYFEKQAYYRMLSKQIQI